MGGLESEVGETTTDVLLEAANFEPQGILEHAPSASGCEPRARTAGRKGVDPHLAEPAAVLASQLIVELTGARFAGRWTFTLVFPEPPVTSLRPERTDELIGLEIEPAEQRDILERLGFSVTDDWAVDGPHLART